MARGVEHVEGDVADLDAVPIAQRPVLVYHARDLVDPDPAAVLQGEDAVPRDMVGVGVRLDYPTSPASWRRHAASTSRTSSGGSTTIASPTPWQPTT